MRVAGQRVRALLILLAMDAGRVVSARSLIERLWADERPVDAANALQSLVSRLRVALRQAGLPDGVVESSAVGYRLAASPAAVDALAFEAQARAGRQALAGGDPATAARLLREALARWRGPALADVAGAGVRRRARPPGWPSCAAPRSSTGSRPSSPSARPARPDRRAARADRGRPARGAPGRAADAGPRRRRPPGRGARRLPANPRPAGGRAGRRPLRGSLSRSTWPCCGRRSRPRPGQSAPARQTAAGAAGRPGKRDSRDGRAHDGAARRADGRVDGDGRTLNVRARRRAARGALASADQLRRPGRGRGRGC